MIDELTFRIGNCTENDARVTLEPREVSEIVGITGFARGPFCKFSKTLTADFPLSPVIQAGVNAQSVEALVIEPCYWTPHLPFLYEFHLKLQMADGRVEDVILRTGLKRWQRVGRNLQLEHKRIVLRGLQCDAPDEQSLQAARQHETTLLVRNPEDRVCELAGQWGVPVIADLREETQLQDICLKLDWYPAVLLILLTPDQLAEVRPPQHCLVAASITGNDPEDCKPNRSDVIAVELPPGKRPHSWLAGSDKPVIAISCDPDSDIPEARSHCDRLQAELAPHFDLAGYIV